MQNAIKDNNKDKDNNDSPQKQKQILIEIEKKIEKSDALCHRCGQASHQERDCPETESFLERDERRRKELRYVKKTRRNFDYLIKYACNPETFYTSLSEEVQNKTDIRQAQLYCMTCSTRADITAENILTLPESLIADGFAKTVFDHSPIYGGHCLRPGCKQ